MTVALAVVSAALAVLVTALVVLLLVRRQSSGGSGGDERIALAVADMNTRMESMVRELSTALERAEHETRRSRILGDVVGSIDLDEVLARTLEAAAAIANVDASLVALPDGADGKPLVATIGLSAEEAQREGVIAGPPDGRAARSVAVSFRYSGEQQEANGALIHAGLTVPVPGEAGAQGFIAIFTRTRERTFGDTELAELEDLAQRAGPAIENARRFREARQQADLDPLTGLHNPRFFHETLAREASRGHRYDRTLSLVVFDLDDFKAVNDRHGHLVGDGVLAEVGQRVREATRAADIACRVGGDEFGVIMPESTLADAEQLYRRLLHAVSSRPIANVGNLLLSAGAAELRPDDDARSFFQRADAALYRAKGSGKGQLNADES